MLIESEAYVLRTTKYSERDLIVDFFVREHGKISVIARSAKTSKRRFPGGLELFSRMKVRIKSVANRSLATLEESDIQDGHPKIREDFDKITIASYITELTAVLVQPNEPADALFYALNTSFTNLEKSNDSQLPQLVLNYELYLTQNLGYAPSLEACYKCGESHQNFKKYRISRGGEGLICVSCKEGERYGIAEKSTMEVFWNLYQDALVEFSNLSQARRIVWASLGPVVDRELKTKGQVEALWERRV